MKYVPTEISAREKYQITAEYFIYIYPKENYRYFTPVPRELMFGMSFMEKGAAVRDPSKEKRRTTG